MQYAEQALQLAQTIGDVDGEMSWLSELGILHGLLGANDQALVCFHQALVALANIYAAQDDIEQASSGIPW